MRKNLNKLGLWVLLCFSFSIFGCGNDCENHYPLFTEEVDKMDDVMGMMKDCNDIATDFVEYYEANRERIEAAFLEYETAEGTDILKEPLCSIDEITTLSFTLRKLDRVNERLTECTEDLRYSDAYAAVAFIAIMVALSQMAGWVKAVEDAYDMAHSSGGSGGGFDDDDD
jgi:hypothetical protein